MPKSKSKSKPKPKAPAKNRLNLLDWLCIVFGVTASLFTVFTDYQNSTIYIAASLFALNCGVMEMVLGIKGRRSSYIFALVCAASSVIVAWADQFYGNMAINIYYIPLSIAGFYSWSRHRDKDKNVIARRLTFEQIILWIIAIIISSAVLNLILTKLDGHSTILDSVATTLVIFASFLGVLRYREQWLVWMAADSLMLLMWIGGSNFAIVALRAFYILGSIYGYVNWRKFVNKSPRGKQGPNASVKKFNIFGVRLW